MRITAEDSREGVVESQCTSSEVRRILPNYEEGMTGEAKERGRMWKRERSKKQEAENGMRTKAVLAFLS